MIKWVEKGCGKENLRMMPYTPLSNPIAGSQIAQVSLPSSNSSSVTASSCPFLLPAMLVIPSCCIVHFARPKEQQTPSS